MNDLPEFSNHAKIRMQQRGISRTLVEFILANGKPTYYAGAKTYLLPTNYAIPDSVPKEVVEKIARRPYVVVSGDGDAATVVTVGWRIQRIKKNGRAFKPRRRGR